MAKRRDYTHARKDSNRDAAACGARSRVTAAHEIHRGTQCVSNTFGADSILHYEFWTRALNLVGSACGNDSDHYLGLRQLGEAPAFANFGACLGIVEAAQHDFEAGLLFDLKSLIVAELAGDFIEQAETLLAAGCHVPAASLAGVVLEDTLRKMCQKRSMPLPDRTSINRLNVDLAKAGAYLRITPNPPKDTDGRREDSGRGWVRELQGRWPGVLG